jgi:CHAD domain-containing protein
MTWSPQQSESLSSALGREIGEQVQRALGSLSVKERVGEAVHEARRAIKRARSLLKMLPGDRASRSRRQEDRTLRDAGRCVAELRDADVLVGVAAGLHLDAPDERVPPALMVSLRADRDRLLDAAHDQHGPLRQGRDRLLTFVVTQPNGDQVDDLELLRVGLVTSYESARTQRRVAFGGILIAESLHELRKRAKNLRYQLEFLDAGTADVRQMVSDLHHLTDLLGDANDLVVLAKYARARSTTEEESRELLLHLEEAAGVVWMEADPLCGRLLSDEADAFFLRVEHDLRRPQG